MKKALMLAGLFLCVSTGYAADQTTRVADGKKRNEEAYERMLQQTGWTDLKKSGQADPNIKNSSENTSPSSQPKSS